MHDITVTIRKRDGEQVEVKLQMADEIYNRFLDMANRRGQPITEIFGEALRLEQLFDEAQRTPNKSLIFRVGDSYQELASV